VISTLQDLSTMQKKMESMHNELLEMIAKLSDGTTSDSASPVFSVPLQLFLILTLL
jgi:hypothetical protein